MMTGVFRNTYVNEKNMSFSERNPNQQEFGVTRFSSHHLEAGASFLEMELATKT